MKKIIAAFVATVAMATAAFAADVSVSGALTFPMVFTTNNFDGTKIKSSSVAVGFEAGCDYFFTDMYGVGVDLSYNKFVSSKYDGDKVSDVKGGNFNVFAGCAIRLLNDDKMIFVVTPGLSFDYASNGQSPKTTTTEFGIGADAKFGYKLMPNLSLDAGLSLVYNFYGTSSYDGKKTDDLKITSFVVTPKLGATYYF